MQLESPGIPQSRTSLRGTTVSDRVVLVKLFMYVHVLVGGVNAHIVDVVSPGLQLHKSRAYLHFSEDADFTITAQSAHTFPSLLHNSVVFIGQTGCCGGTQDTSDRYTPIGEYFAVREASGRVCLVYLYPIYHL